MKLIVLCSILLLMLSCGAATSEEAEKKNSGEPWTADKSLENIRALQNKLYSMPAQTEEEILKMSATRSQLIDSLYNFSEKYSGHEKMQSVLGSLYLLCAASESTVKGLKVGDRIINEFPQFPDRKQVIQSQIDWCIRVFLPVDRKKVAGYYKMLIDESLEEDPEIMKENERLYLEYSSDKN